MSALKPFRLPQAAYLPIKHRLNNWSASLSGLRPMSLSSNNNALRISPRCRSWVKSWISLALLGLQNDFSDKFQFFDSWSRIPGSYGSATLGDPCKDAAKRLSSRWVLYVDRDCSNCAEAHWVPTWTSLRPSITAWAANSFINRIRRLSENEMPSPRSWKHKLL